MDILINKLLKSIESYEMGQETNLKIINKEIQGNIEEAVKDFYILEGAIRATRIVIDDLKCMLKENDKL